MHNKISFQHLVFSTIEDVANSKNPLLIIRKVQLPFSGFFFYLQKLAIFFFFFFAGKNLVIAQKQLHL